jgi:hypothetical protein
MSRLEVPPSAVVPVAVAPTLAALTPALAVFVAIVLGLPIGLFVAAKVVMSPPIVAPVAPPAPTPTPAPAPAPAPTPAVDPARDAGKALLAGLPSVEAAGLRAMATSALSGAAMADVMAAGKAARHAADSRLRVTTIIPVLGRIVPEGSEPKDAATRAAFAAALHAMADAMTTEGR